MMAISYKDNLSATSSPPLHHNVISSSKTVKVAIGCFALYYAVFKCWELIDGFSSSIELKVWFYRL